MLSDGRKEVCVCVCWGWEELMAAYIMGELRESGTRHSPHLPLAAAHTAGGGEEI